MNRVLLIIGGVLVGLLAALFTIPAFVDWTRYRGVFEEEASRLTGREVRVDGRVNLRLLPSPTISFEKVRVSDTQAAVGAPLFRADEFTVWLSVSPLLAGSFEATEIELKRPAVALVLDDKGGGNWTSLVQPAAKSRFSPAQVSLDRVRVTDGTVSVYGPGAEPRARVEHINGELSAQAIEGPYRVTAAFLSGGEPREIRLSTAKADGDGTIRLKGTLRTPQSGTTFTLDGQLEDLFRQPRLAGDLTAKLPLPSIAGPAGATDGKGRDAAEASYDLRARMKADTSGAEFSDIALSFEQDGKPQIATGTAQVAWQRDLAAKVDLSSRWLDLDRVGGRDASAPLSHVLARLAGGLDAALPAAGQTVVRLSLDQATLGGDVVSGLVVALERSNGELRSQVSAALPGSTRLAASGVINMTGAETLFAGDVSVRGASASRFAAWAARNTPLREIKQDGPFVVSGQLAVGPRRVSGRNLVIQLAGNSLTGDASWATGADGVQLTLALEGSDLDLTPLAEAGASPGAILRALAERLKGAHAAADGKPGTPGGLAGLDAKLRIGKVVAGSTVIRDLGADLKLADGNLTMPLLRMGTEDGSSLELRGDVSGLLRGATRGAITYALNAIGPAGLSEFLDLVEVDASLRPERERMDVLLPAKLAGRLRVGDGNAGIQDVSVDGTVGPGRVAGSLRLDPRGMSWRDYPADIAATIESTDAARLLAMLLPAGAWSLPPDPPRAATTAPTRLSLRGVGTAKAGLSSLIALDAAQAAAEFRGRVTVSDTAAMAVEGDLRVTAPDAAAALAVVGLRERAGLAGQMLSGLLAVSASGPRVRLSSSRLQVGPVALAGQIEHDGSIEGARLTGKLAASEVSLPSLVSLLSTVRGGSKPGAAATAPAWGEDVFDLSSLTAGETNLRIDAASFLLAPGVPLGKSALDVTARAGRIDLVLAEAAALGGKTAGALKLHRTPGGVHATLEARLDGGKLEQAAADPAAPAISGPVSLRLDAESTAVSPRGLVAALKGKGEIKLGAGRFNRLSPAAVREAVAAFLAQKGEAPAGDLRRRLEAAIAASGLAVAARTLAVEIGDGLVRLAPVTLESADGRVTGTTVVDLEALRFDSEWKLELASGPAPPPSAPIGTAKARAPLPPISVVYAGPVRDIASIEPKLQSDALEREVAVRKMERDVEELERLRRADEERARQQAVQQEALRQEQLRQRNGSASAPAPGPAPQAAPPAIGPQGEQPAQPALPKPPGSQGAESDGVSVQPLPPLAGQPPAGVPPEAVPAVKSGLGAETRPVPQPRPAQRPPPTREVFQKLDRSSP